MSTYIDSIYLRIHCIFQVYLYSPIVYVYVFYRLVIDTAFLFQRDGSPADCPSLREASHHVLGYDLPDIHDSVRDANIALALAQFLHVHGLQPPVPRLRIPNGNANPLVAGATTTESTNHGGLVDGAKELLVHRIPDNCSETDVYNMMLTYTHVVPTSVPPITRGDSSAGAPSGKTNVQFLTSEHCHLAFESIAGPNRPDKSNKPQKRVYLRGGGYICVRKV